MEFFSQYHPTEIAPNAASLSRPQRLIYPELIHHEAAGWSAGIHFESLANLAHELRTPVQVLLGYLDILRDNHEVAGPKELTDSRDQTIIERMNVNVHELAQTVENVLEFALSFASADAATEEEVELAELFAEMEDILRASNRNQDLAIRINLRGAPLTVVMRRRALRSIVLNLALNAIKFTADGAVTISARRSIADPQTLEIEVRDTGPGISRDLLSSAFEPLIQLSNTSVRRHRGLGLGLAVVQRNVRVLGGRVQVESRPGDGSCFRVTIPASCPASYSPTPVLLESPA